MAFNPLQPNAQILYLINNQIYNNDTFINSSINYPAFPDEVAKLYTITCDNEGNLKIYKNTGGDRAMSTSSNPINIVDFKGDLYLFGTPVTPQISKVSNIKNANFPVNHVQLINRVLTSEEIGKMFGGDVTDLH